MATALSRMGTVSPEQALDFPETTLPPYAPTPHIYSLPIRVAPIRLSATSRALKRVLDICGSLAALTLAFPVLLITALAIKLTSRGPILFTQMRVGQGGKLFKMYKFRSMIQGSERLCAELAKQNEVSGPVFKIRKDPRITPVGAFIRKYSIDELPQLWNVLRGEMSLVGPRPAIPKEVMQYSPDHLRRLAGKPGLTCIWQVSGRSNIPFAEWMKLDLYYLDNWSIWLDLVLILKTFRAVFRGTGAY